MSEDLLAFTRDQYKSPAAVMSVWMTYVNRRKSSSARIQLKYPTVGVPSKEEGWELGNKDNHNWVKAYEFVTHN